jgi:Carboxypeptidase regulatory-like domain
MTKDHAATCSRMKVHAVTIPVLGLVLFGIARPLSSQIIEMREYKGKTISCGRSGLRGWGETCGLDADYTYIFTGTVLSRSDISDAEKRLQVTPHEMFRGVPATQLTVVTEQDDCLPELRVGEEWLLYLQRDEKAHSLVLAYGSLSKPIAEAQQEISTLRRTIAMSDSGLIIGNVSHYVRDDSDGDKSTTTELVANHKVSVVRQSDGAEYSTISDSDGNYEFEPLPIGSYTLTANTQPGLWAPDWAITIRPRSCHAYQFELHADGRISGHVRAADGKPFAEHPWVNVVSEDGGHTDSAYVDDEGRFEARGLEPGCYFVGLGINAQPNSAEWRARIYYPGVRSRDQAIVVELATAERRTNVDFRVPQPPAP